MIIPYTGTPGNDINLNGTVYDDHMWGYGGNDTFSSGIGHDRLYGGLGIDTLHGGPGYDMLYGEENNDILQGGLDRDFLVGGAGADKFKFRNGDSGCSTDLSKADVIADFRYKQGDKIDLSLTNVSYFGKFDGYPEPNEVSYWFRGNDTVVSFNDGGQINDIVLNNFNADMIASDFIL